jgi:peptide deformylase
MALSILIPMAILKIARMGHPVLKSPAKPVPDPTAPAIRRLVADMIETMEDAPGTGLAAPQVHVPLRLVIFKVAAGRADEEVPLTVLINPAIDVLTEERELGLEGCLSVPGFMGAVPRATHIRYRGVDLDNRPLEREARDFHARVVQHECDHLDGILYPQRMTDLRLFGYTEEMRRALAPEAQEPAEVD